ncbi:MAG: methylenetetrahydrofolate reductase [Pseudonocardia sp.]|nr:methylenetetrahydrofolate reductase [Pseudonocardia sp.]
MTEPVPALSEPLSALLEAGVEVPGCPKHMTYGPCGGVREDLGCEVEPAPCPFAAETGPVHWAGPAPPRRPEPALLVRTRGRPLVLTDLSVPPYDAATVRRTVSSLSVACDAILVGEHHDEPDFPPTMLASLVREAGGHPWITLTCRDRNRVVLEQEVAGLAATGTDGVFCATGDARAPGMRPDATQVFDLDGTRLAGLAAAAGLSVAVPETPDAPPRGNRAGRLAQKQLAGAQLAVLNHAGSAEHVAAFAGAVRAEGASLPIVAGVAVYTDEPSARLLQAFPGLELDQGRVEAVLSAPDPVAAGIDAAVAEARELMAVDGVAGVNLSGRGTSAGFDESTAIKAEIGRRIRSEV